MAVKYYLNEQNLRVHDDKVEHLALLRYTNMFEERLEPCLERSLPVSGACRVQLAHILFRQLGQMAQDSFEQIKREQIIEENPVAAWDIKLATAEQRKRASHRLLEELRRTNMGALFERAPLLEEWLLHGVERFAAFATQMLDRLTADAQDICRAFFPRSALGSIKGISADGADVHFHGCLTCAIESEGGKFVYKPHSCEAGAIASDIVGRWFADVLVVPQCLVRDGYGYTRFIESAPLDDESAVARYYRRLGGACAVFQALGSSDLHADNWVPMGEYPALVDLETILTPSPRVYANPEVMPSPPPRKCDFLYDANNSLIPSGLLPQSHGQDQISIFLAAERDGTGCPVLGGQRITAIGYEDEVLAGFVEVYDRCIGLKAELIKALDAFRGVPVRRLVRHTEYYGRVQRSLYSMRALQSRKAQEDVCASLGKYFLKVGARHMLPIAQWECECLSEGDIPYFSVMGDGADLLGYGNVVVPDFFEETGIENARLRIERLDAVEREFERQLLYQCLNTSIRSAPVEERPMSIDAPISPAQAMTSAQEVFRYISDTAVTGPSGMTNWFMRRADAKALSNGQPKLGQGTLGLGVFLSAMAAFGARADSARAAQLASTCVEQVKSELQNLRLARALSESVVLTGVSDGVGGVIQALMLIHRYLPSLDCLSVAIDVAKLLDRYSFVEVRYSDVFSGLAGLLLALDALPEDGSVDRSVRRAADRLLEMRMPSGAKDAGLWDTLGRGWAISGAGHGQVGIAAALLAAARRLRDARYVDGALAALEFEHGVYSEKLDAWPDLRDTSIHTHAMHGLCSGAPGIGLALLHCRDSAAQLGIELPHMTEDLDRALRITLGHAPMYRDHLCCGNSSAVDFLLEAAVALPERAAECREAALRRLGGMYARRERLGSYTLLPPGYAQVPVVNFFYGEAGVGYELLRSTDPARIRPVLFSRPTK